jgi:hypothetical protein
MLHHVHVSLHGTTTPTSATTPGLSKMASGRVLLTVHNRCTSAATVVLEDAADATVLTFTNIPAGGSKTLGFDATAQDYKIEYTTTELLTLTAIGIARILPAEVKAAVITTTQKHVGEIVTVTSPAAFNGNAAKFTQAFKWQRAVSPFSSWTDIDDTNIVQASYSTNLAGATNNDLKFTAIPVGILGNVVSITYVDPGGTTAALSVTESGSDITVNLGRAGSAVNTTATALKAAIDARTGAGQAGTLVTVANVTANDGSGLVAALSKQTLSGGTDAVDADNATESAGYEAAVLDVDDKVRLKTTATSPEGSVVSYSNASGVVIA